MIKLSSKTLYFYKGSSYVAEKVQSWQTVQLYNQSCSQQTSLCTAQYTYPYLLFINNKTLSTLFIITLF